MKKIQHSTENSFIWLYPVLNFFTENTITGTMVIQPGTLVKFMEYTYSNPLTCTVIPYETKLIFSDGGKLLAQGTTSQPIIFRAVNVVSESTPFEFTETASNDSIFEYCDFENRGSVTTHNSITVQYCRFDDSFLFFCGNQY